LDPNIPCYSGSPLRDGASATYTYFAHPSGEHFLPLFVAPATAGGGIARRIHPFADLGTMRMNAHRFA
jgi:hypothetical protein